MNILAIDSALNNSYIALQKDKNIISKIIKSDENYHSLYLIKEIKALFEQINSSFDDLDLITVNCGFGSFTGIRVALTIAKVMAGELNLPIIPLTTNEILLNSYEADLLLMDARRDMYYLSDKNNTNLIYKDKIDDLIKNKKILCDKRSSSLSKNSICFEEIEKDLGKTMIKLALEKYSNANNKDDFNYLKIKANYIQTPPIFGV